MRGIVNRFCFKGLQLLGGAKHWLLPRRCRLCDVVHLGRRNICPNCVGQFPKLPLCCAVCAEPLSAAGVDCMACLQEPPAFLAAHVAWRWGSPVSGLIKRFKFNGNRSIGSDVAAAFADQMAVRIEELSPRPDCLLPMPLHTGRLRSRGFNQSYILASALSKACRLPLSNAVVRVRATPAQSGLSRSQRQKNLRGAFAVRGDVMGMNVLVVDDVMTTGSSAQELATTLMDAGAKSVQIVVVCKVI